MESIFSRNFMESRILVELVDEFTLEILDFVSKLKWDIFDDFQTLWWCQWW